MLSIGEFSKICEVSTKTLRYYDEIGLIHPDEINPENGYRYYSIRQLKTMLFINRLKSYHFSLEEIKTMVEMEPDQSEEQLRSALHLKRRETQERIDALEYTMKQLSHDIENVENGIPIMAYLDRIEVQLVEMRPMNLLYLRQTMSSNDYALGYGSYFSRLYKKIADEKLTLTGTPMTIYHNPEYNPTGNDTEFAIPIAEAVKGTRNLPASLCAKSVLKGSYSELSSVYSKLREWTEKEKYELAGPPYEIYVTDPNQAAAAEDIITEVHFPVKKK
ncbi:DNA-binding transcriptional regulator, MerR family [Evansella caseinilytica]|uniref:DNA-binding transcriptional regulator, MerR family n=1 Tax=Evansella caseinilytica TaxID=1503961 RepID=A0A1H3SMA3_9BACI|nr:MerR family transcriptional regulator [Evansella caseinilytica]SDZ38818.1 DNA-binding transcriptional regulator, MerR family [Evansella caseinilytica]